MSLRSLRTSLALPAVLLALPGCGDRSTPEAEPANTTYPREVLQAHMKDHFYRATEMQLAVINDDLEGLREPAEWMADHASSAAMPEEWISHAAAIHAAARSAATAEDLPSAATAVARMAGECGNCHLAFGAEVGFAIEKAPPKGEGTKPHMGRHAWASGRLWEGLIAPSGVVWDGGAEVLAEAPLSPPDLSADIDVLAEVTRMEGEVHALGAGAVGMTLQEERARVYGELLATCATCHEKTGRGRI